MPPLGYGVQDRKLVMIDREADTVRLIFRRYAELGSVRLLKSELEARGIKSKSWTSASGRLVGGKPFSRGALYLMLQNRIKTNVGEFIKVSLANDITIPYRLLCSLMFTYIRSRRQDKSGINDGAVHTIDNAGNPIGAAQAAGVGQTEIRQSGEATRAGLSAKQERRRLGYARCRWQARQLDTHHRRSR